jgi:hypothetical protein
MKFGVIENENSEKKNQNVVYLNEGIVQNI